MHDSKEYVTLTQDAEVVTDTIQTHAMPVLRAATRQLPAVMPMLAPAMLAMPMITTTLEMPTRTTTRTTRTTTLETLTITTLEAPTITTLETPTTTLETSMATLAMQTTTLAMATMLTTPMAMPETPTEMPTTTQAMATTQTTPTQETSMAMLEGTELRTTQTRDSWKAKDAEWIS
jgi:hypothetical protein